MADEYILGFSDSINDRAVCLFNGATPLVGLEEERLNRCKHGVRLYGESRTNPSMFSILNLEAESASETEKGLLQLADYCLDYAGITWNDVKICIGNSLHLGFPLHSKAVYLNHHLAHASSSFYASGFEKAAIIVADGYGDLVGPDCYETVMLATGDNLRINPIDYTTGKVSSYYDMENSLGVFYRIGTLLSGFGIFDEGKTMGLSSYGKPRFIPEISQHVRFEKSGRVLIDNKTLWETLSQRFIGQNDFSLRADIAASFQTMLEDILLAFAAHLHEVSDTDCLCIAGGVAVNCVANARILRESKFKKLFVFPGPGDNGIAFGAAYYAAHSLLGLPRTPTLEHAYFGRPYSDAEIRAAIEASGLKSQEMTAETLPSEVAQIISQGNIIVWFQGGAEFGPRALGHRSFIASPARVETKDFINAHIKFRESFRPLAPIVLEEFSKEYFDLDCASPFMLLAPPVHEKAKKDAPAVVHCDGTARVQTLNRNTNSRLYDVINEFRKLTGVPIVLNTSLNLKDEPIVETPQEAIKSFLTSKCQYMVLEHFILRK